MVLAPFPTAIVLLAAVRPEGLNLPLFVHVLGAVALVGAASAAAAVAVGSRTDAAGWSRRLAFRLALLATLPAYIVMRVGAEWIRVAEFGDSSSAGWRISQRARYQNGYASRKPTCDQAAGLPGSPPLARKRK